MSIATTKLPAPDPRLVQVRSAYTKIVPSLPPNVRQKLIDLGLQLATQEVRTPSHTAGQYQSRASALVDAQRFSLGVSALKVSLAEVCFILLMEATNDQDQDLELIMAETKAQTNSKQALRDIISRVGRDVAANAQQTFGSSTAARRSLLVDALLNVMRLLPRR